MTISLIYPIVFIRENYKQLCVCPKIRLILSLKYCTDTSSLYKCFGGAGLLGQHNTIASTEIIEGGVMAAMLTLICTAKHKSQLAGLQVLASLALVSDAAAQKLMSERLLTALQV